MHLNRSSARRGRAHEADAGAPTGEPHAATASLPPRARAPSRKAAAAAAAAVATPRARGAAQARTKRGVPAASVPDGAASDEDPR